MSDRLQVLRPSALAFLLGAFVACGSHPPDSGDGGPGSGGSGGSGAGASGGAGAGASGGSAGSVGGSGGVGGGGGSGTGGAGGTGPCGCSTATMTWWMDGGLAILRDIMELHPCQTFVLTREAAADPPGTRACKQELGDCTNSLSASDVNAAVAHPDVQRAIAMGHVLYGQDTRPFDGQVMVIEFGARIEVGVPCNGVPMCNPIPPGVDALANLLNNLTKQELARGACRMTFPSAP